MLGFDCTLLGLFVGAIGQIKRLSNCCALSPCSWLEGRSCCCCPCWILHAGLVIASVWVEFILPVCFPNDISIFLEQLASGFATYSHSPWPVRPLEAWRLNWLTKRGSGSALLELEHPRWGEVMRKLVGSELGWRCWWVSCCLSPKHLSRASTACLCWTHTETCTILWKTQWEILHGHVQVKQKDVIAVEVQMAQKRLLEAISGVDFRIVETGKKEEIMGMNKTS